MRGARTPAEPHRRIDLADRVLVTSPGLALLRRGDRAVSTRLRRLATAFALLALIGPATVAIPTLIQ